jgi:hypothetical protein
MADLWGEDDSDEEEEKVERRYAREDRLSSHMLNASLALIRSIK